MHSVDAVMAQEFQAAPVVPVVLFGVHMCQLVVRTTSNSTFTMAAGATTATALTMSDQFRPWTLAWIAGQHGRGECGY